MLHRTTKGNVVIVDRAAGDKLVSGNRYVWAQVLPPVPQRFEWIRADKLTPIKNDQDISLQ